MPPVAKSSRLPKTKSPKKPVILSSKNPDNALKKLERNEKGIIYVKHLPQGFFENQLRSFFSQFGDVTRVHVARSKKTLRSRGYAYVEFRYREVAQIAAETMNNYLMFGKILKTGILPAGTKRIPRKCEKAFDSNGKETTTYKLWLKRMVLKSNGRVTKTKVVNRNNRALAKLKQLKQKFAEQGVDYDVDAVIPEFDEDDIKKPIADAEEKRSKAGKKKSIEQKKADNLEIFLKNVKSQDLEQDSSDEDEDAGFVPLEKNDWDAAESDDDLHSGKKQTKKAALKQASKTKETFTKEKVNALQKRSKSSGAVAKSEKQVTQKNGVQKTKPQVSPFAGASSKKAQQKIASQKDKPSSGRVTKQSKVKPQKQKSKQEASSTLKSAAKAFLQDSSVKKVKAKDINKKKEKKKSK